MRRFSDEQKDIIRRINNADGAGSDLMSLLDPYLCEAGVKMGFKNGTTVDMWYPSQTTTLEGTKKCQRIHRLIARMARLICYLKDNDYIIPIISTHEHICDKEYGKFPQAEALLVDIPVPWPIPDATTKKFILESLGKEFVPTPLLASLIENGFTTDEDIRFSRQRQQTWVAIGVAFIVGLASLLLGVWSHFNGRSDARCRAVDARKAADVEAVRWQALLSVESNKVNQLGEIRFGLAQVARSISSLTNKPTPAAILKSQGPVATNTVPSSGRQPQKRH